MKIAYILTPHAAVDKSNGIRSQAMTWAEALRWKGHQVDYINPWEHYDWLSYDAIHFFGSGPWASTTRTYVRIKNPKCVFSPIYDPTPFHETASQYWQKKLSKLTYGKYSCAVYAVANEYKNYSRILVRTNYEREKIHELFDVPDNLIIKVPLSFSHNLNPDDCLPAKEPFVFHMSLFTQPRKNVVRLVKAAKKYGFKLVIAGNYGTSEALDEFRKIVNNSPNIELLGFISEEQKLDLYRKAKVFALPSISEGVGIVAVDAALYGADIVITEIGGPKEYYDGMAEIVNPNDVDAIGQACMNLLNGKTYQPKLRERIIKEYSLSAVADKLIEVYYML